MNILIIEDSKSVAHILESILRTKGHITKALQSKEVNSRLFKDNVFDFIIINTSCEYNSISLLKEIRSLTKNVFILGLSTKSTWKDKVVFLNNGGDDVINYPFPIDELEARINSLLRRPKDNTNGVLNIKGINIDSEGKQVKINNKDIDLRRREFALLEYMVRNKNRTISRAELLDHVWDYRRATGSNTVDVHIKRLRDKLMDKDLIETVHGFGYTIRDQKTESKASSALSDE